jgi:hypothetical protein
MPGLGDFGTIFSTTIGSSTIQCSLDRVMRVLDPKGNKNRVSGCLTEDGLGSHLKIEYWRRL